MVRVVLALVLLGVVMKPPSEKPPYRRPHDRLQTERDEGTYSVQCWHPDPRFQVHPPFGANFYPSCEDACVWFRELECEVVTEPSGEVSSCVIVARGCGSDEDCDGDVDLADWAVMQTRFGGPGEKHGRE